MSALKVKKDMISSNLKALVDAIKNPAYVVKEGSRKGLVVVWNKELEELTKFTHSDICGKYCYDIFEGVQKRFDDRKVFMGDVPVCNVECKVKNKKGKTEPWFIKDFWIKSKNDKGDCVRRHVEAYIIPFKTKRSKFALHILIDKGE